MLPNRSACSLMRYHYVNFRAFFALIVGSKGSTKKRIEGETKTQVKIPKAGVDGDIEVTGSTREAVSSARRRIDIIVLSSRSKQQATHFMCVPVIQPAIKENYRRFKVQTIEIQFCNI